MLDPARARAEADAAERRGNGTLWAAGPVAREGVSVGSVSQAEVVPSVEEGGDGTTRRRPRSVPTMTRAAPPSQPDGARVPTALLAAILARLEMAPPRRDDVVPGWLTEAVGNPLTYDAASPHRIDVCVRVDPALYRRLQALKKRLSLRTTAGGWEYVLRAGLATADCTGHASRSCPVP